MLTMYLAKNTYNKNIKWLL